jgi:integrase
MTHRVAEVIANYGPKALSPQASAFAREVVSRAAPGDVVRTKALLFAAGRLGMFCQDHAIALAVERCLSDSVIERFVATGCDGYSVATKRTLRANLRCLATARVAGRPPVPALGRDRAKRPYSRGEIAAYLRLADAQPNAERRARLVALICLGAGAGLMGRELRGVVGRDVVSRSGGVLVVVRQTRARVVPVRAAFWRRLNTATAVLGADAYLIGGTQLERRNVTSRLVGSVAGGTDLARLDTGRLRATWLYASAEAIGLSALLTAAGISCPQRLGDIISAAPSPSESELVRRLSGRRH